MSEIGLVYLARARSGLEPFERFAQAYRERQGGIAHDLIVVFKGRWDEAQIARCRSSLRGSQYRELSIWDWGFDVRAYALAIRSLPQPYFCFLNTFSVPLDADWLAKIYACGSREDIGLVGATGSYESMYSNALNEPSPSPLLARLERWLRMHVNRMRFAPFPTPHIRTNAFLISRALMLECWPRFALTKHAAYLIENGRDGLTKRILDRGLRVQIVGRDGVGYDVPDWPVSNAFRQGDQQNLLVADKQTETYRLANAELRNRLSRLAWGEQARPG